MYWYFSGRQLCKCYHNFFFYQLSTDCINEWWHWESYFRRDRLLTLVDTKYHFVALMALHQALVQLLSGFLFHIMCDDYLIIPFTAYCLCSVRVSSREQQRAHLFTLMSIIAMNTLWKEIKIKNSNYELHNYIRDAGIANVVVLAVYQFICKLLKYW